MEAPGGVFRTPKSTDTAAVEQAARASAAGLIAAFYIDAAPAPTIVLLLAAGFVAAFAISGQRAAIAARG